jgi:hypothetical protein
MFRPGKPPNCDKGFMDPSSLFAVAAFPTSCDKTNFDIRGLNRHFATEFASSLPVNLIKPSTNGPRQQTGSWPPLNSE